MSQHLPGVLCLHTASSTVSIRTKRVKDQPGTACAHHINNASGTEVSDQIMNERTNAHNDFKLSVGRKKGREGKERKKKNPLSQVLLQQFSCCSSISLYSVGPGERSLAAERGTFHTLGWMCWKPFFRAGPPTSCQGGTSHSHAWFAHTTLAQGTFTKTHYFSAHFLAHAYFLVISHLLFAFIRSQVRQQALIKRPAFSYQPEKFSVDESMADKRCFISHQLQQEVYGSLELFFLNTRLLRVQKAVHEYVGVHQASKADVVLILISAGASQITETNL